MKKAYLLIFALLSSCALMAWEGALMQSIEADHTRSGVCLHGYEFMPIEDTPAPKGYMPFYISHYGRLIFYKPTRMAAKDVPSDQILVKILYNERERQLLDLTPVSGPYYRWYDLRAILLNPIAIIPTSDVSSM